MKKLILGLPLLFILATCPNFWDICLASSIFSANGFVEENYGLDNYSIGMGQTGISSLFRKNISICNPALNGTVSQANFSSNLIFGYNYYKDANSKYKDKIADFPYIKIIIPVTKSDFIGISFIEKYHLGLETCREDSIQDIGNISTYQNLSGSINQIGFSYTRKMKSPILGILIGANLNYNFGNENNEISIDFDDNEFVDHFECVEKKYECANFSFGFAIPYSKFSFGGFYESTLNMNSDKKYTIQYNPDLDFDYIEVVEKKIKFPSQIGLGIGMQITDYLYAETNYRHSFWKNSTYSGMNDRDSKFISVGLSYIPYKKLFWKVPTRLGGYYKQLPCKKNGHFIDEKALTFGFDIPLNEKNKGNISLALIWGVRGDISKNLYKDEFIKLSIGFSSVDLWRNPKKFKKDKEIPKLDKKYEVPD
ncbi:MAG: hypothetical protein KAW92_09890 [Candidatus Cloacimonetes bacterium]|nr:hypothetical protein [Candidatus Cloacimonadota bacterium]